MTTGADDLDASEDDAAHYFNATVRLTARLRELEQERDRLAGLIGVHDPTGADHMEDAARLAVENDTLRDENRRLREALR